MSLKFANSISSKVKNMDNRIISISELEDLGDDALGLQLLVECHEATYFGVLNHLLKDHHRTCLWLEKVCIPMSGEQRLIGLKKLYLPNIISIIIIGLDLEIQKKLLQEIGAERKHLLPLVMKRIVPSEQIKDSDDTDGLLCENLNSGSDFLFSDVLRQITSEVPRYKNIPRPTILKLIDEIGNEFQKAVDNIEKESSVCLSGQGMKLSRCGTLMWLCVSTSSIIYIFDVSKIDPKVCFSNKLKVILGNIEKVKILNDARRLQDYFAHHHDITMCNVFDTQASHIYLHMQEHKSEAPYLIKNLPSLLQEYFGLPPKLLKKMFPEIVDESVWLERPLSNALQNTLAFSVMFLRELQQCLLDLILVDLQQVNNIFVDAFCRKTTLEVQRVEESVVPYEIHQLRKPIIRNTKISYSKEKINHR